MNKIDLWWRIITPEVRQKHFWEAIEEANLRFLLASLKGETFTISGVGQARLSSRIYK